jgi:broad specificity phosphatase PhoE
MKALLIKHGETDWEAEKKVLGIEDVPLNEREKNKQNF